MNNKEERKGFNLKEVILIIIASAIITSTTTGIIVFNQNKLTKNITYQDLNKDNALKEFLKVYASLIDEYYEDVNKTEMLESAIGAMFNYLGEDYSTYMNKAESDYLNEQLEGEYKGIGITINKDRTIIDFIKGSPAKEAGIAVGDIITKVNGKEIEETTDITDIIKNANVGENIKITVLRGNEALNFDVKSKKLYVPAINYKMIEENIGYLQIETFSNTLKEQVAIALKELEENNLNSLIIDLRNNTGGYLNAAKDVASMFLEKGKIIYSLEEKTETKEFKDTTEEHRNYKVILLFNEHSASASEILIAALEESYEAITVGTTSYGKGKVQQTHTLEDGSMIKYTSAKWLTPSGKCIDQEGIKPQYVIENQTEIDNQLEKAIELAK